MDYLVGVKVGQGQGHVVDEVELHVVREGAGLAFQKLRETFIH